MSEALSVELKSIWERAKEIDICMMNSLDDNGQIHSRPILKLVHRIWYQHLAQPASANRRRTPWFLPAVPAARRRAPPQSRRSASAVPPRHPPQCQRPPPHAASSCTYRTNPN